MQSRLKLAIGAAAAALLTSSAPAQERPGPLTLTTHALKGGAYWVEGGRSNTGFIVGDKGVIVLDAQMPPDGAQKEMAEIAKVTNKPITHIIITHADPDHVIGLPLYPAGTPMIAHENTWTEIEASAVDPAGPPPAVAGYKKIVAGFLPQHTVGETETMMVDGVRMVLMHVAPAHTSGDLVVYLPTQKIVYAGDIITTNNGRFPVIHLGGSSLGWIATMKAMLALKADTYVSGHGAIETRPQLEARVRGVEQRRAAIKTMVMTGKTRAEVDQAFPEPGSNPQFLNFTQSTYDELTKGYPVANPPWTNLVKR